jgi:hypothetical protein
VLHLQRLERRRLLSPGDSDDRAGENNRRE